MKVIVDVQLPHILVRDLRRRGHEASRVVDLIARTSTDDLVCTLASVRKAAIFTKDEDFVGLSARVREPVTVVWLRCGNISNAELLKLIDRTIDYIIAAIERGERLIEVR